MTLNAWLTQLETNGDREAFDMVCWVIWRTRYKLVFEKQHFDPVFIIHSALKLLSEFRVVNSKEHMPRADSNEPLLQWKPPLFGFLKINTDAVVSRDAGIGLGVVIRNDTGQVKLATAKLLSTQLGVDNA